MKGAVILPWVDREGALRTLQQLRPVWDSLHSVVEVIDPGAVPASEETTHIIWPAPFELCKAWREEAAKLLQGGADFVLLFGDDVDVFRPRQMLQDIAEKIKQGAWVVSVKEETSPCWPSFPAISQHWFQEFGEVFPAIFVNQDADPFVWAAARKLNRAATTADIHLRNRVGGLEGGVLPIVAPRYQRCHMPSLSRSLDKWLADREVGLSIDIIVPSVRVPIKRLRSIAALRAPEGANVQFTFVIDNPGLATKRRGDLRALELEEECLIRVNNDQIGAAMSRQRGIDESLADFVLCLDDDVDPQADLLEQYVDAVRKFPNYDVYAGVTEVPYGGAEGFHAAYLTYFFRVALDQRHPPWCVTANVLHRRRGLQFKPVFHWAGGGEDVDVCVGRQCVAVPTAVVTHPVWPGGRRVQLFRAFHWALRDSALNKIHREHTYRPLPSGVEWFAVLLFISARLSVLAVATDFLIGVLVCRFWNEPQIGHPEPGWAAAAEASCFRMASEAGHLAGQLGTWPVEFDWMLLGRSAKRPRSLQRWLVFAVVTIGAVSIMASQHLFLSKTLEQ